MLISDWQRIFMLVLIGILSKQVVIFCILQSAILTAASDDSSTADTTDNPRTINRIQLFWGEIAGQESHLLSWLIFS